MILSIKKSLAIPPAVKWILPYMAKYKWKLIFGFVVNKLIMITALVNPYLAGRIVVDVIQGSRTYLLTYYLIAMIGITFARSWVRYGFRLLYEDISQTILFELRRDVFHKLQSQNFKWFDENWVGDVMSRMTGDLDAIKQFLAFEIFALPENVLLYLSALVMIAVINLPLALAMIVFTPIVLFATLKAGKEMKPVFRDLRQQFSNLNSVCAENIAGNRVVKAFAKESYEIEKFTKANQAFHDSNIEIAKIRVKYMPIMESCAALLPIVLLLLGSYLVIYGDLQVWQLVTVSGYIWMLENPTRMFGQFVSNTQNFITSLEKIHDMMETPILIQNPEKPVSISRINGNLEFKNVSFGYERDYVLKDVSFSVKQGQTLGIVGDTGSGKTTLVNLISRFYDVHQGEVLLDGINVKDFNLADLRSRVSYAMQDVFLFSDTVEGNIAYGAPDASMDKVYRTAQIADAHQFVKGMPESYETVVGERGVGLSGGQKQRLSLARAITPDPAVLILDDVTSAVDMETELRIRKALKNQVQQANTMVIVAHRLSAVKDADLILVLENGRIIERGNHEELISTGGYYAQAFEEQKVVA